MASAYRFEQLENRLALAAVLQYIDIDGDIVTVKTSQGSENDLTTALVFSAAATNVRRQLQTVDFLSNPTVFGGTTLAITVKKAGDGDGLAAVGRIRAFGMNVGKISIQGDLGQVDAGSGIQAVPAIVSLTVDSLGRYGIGTGAGTTRSRVDGRVDVLKVRRDVVEATFEAGGIGRVTIGGSLIGGDTDRSGLVEAGGTIGTVSIGGSIMGGAGEDSGQIASTAGSLNSVTVRGSLIGGAGTGSGAISALRNIGSVSVQGDLIGAPGASSGSILSLSATETTRRIAIGGSVVGGSGFRSGSVRIGLDDPTRLAVVEVRGDVRGGAGPGSGVLAAETFGRVAIGGSLIGGDGPNSGNVGDGFGALVIVQTTTIDSLSIAGSVVGGAGSSSGSVNAARRLGVGSIGGSVVGGDGFRSGLVTSGGESGERFTLRQGIVGGTGASSGSVQIAAKTVVVGGSVVGGSASDAGTVVMVAERATIKGSLVGSSGRRSGRCLVAATQKLTIGGDLVGGDGLFSGTIEPVVVNGLNPEVGQIAIGGNVWGGSGAFSGSIAGSASIQSLSIRGSVTGQRSNPVLIVGTSSTGESLGRVTVGGTVTDTLILAGYTVDSSSSAVTVEPVDAAAIIGSITIAGDLQRSSIVAGVQNPGFPNFGDDDDRIIPIPSLPPFRGTIESVSIGGIVTGSDDPLKKFGIVAFEMGSVKIGGQSITLPDPGGIIPLGISSNVHLHLLS